MPFPAKASVHLLAFRAVTIGLGLAYLVAALAFARPGSVMDLGWPARFDFEPSLLLAVLTLYGCAWVLGKWNGRCGPQRASWRGAACGVLALLVAIVLAGSWNAGQDIIRFAPFPGTTPTDFYRHVGNCCYDYIVKPLAWVMPLGGVVAGLLGGWAGRRAARAPR